MSKQTSVLLFFKKTTGSESVVQTLADVNEDVQLSEDANEEDKKNQALSSSILDDSRDPYFGVDSTEISQGPFQPVSCFKVTVVNDKNRQFKDTWYREFGWV